MVLVYGCDFQHDSALACVSSRHACCLHGMSNGILFVLAHQATHAVFICDTSRSSVDERHGVLVIVKWTKWLTCFVFGLGLLGLLAFFACGLVFVLEKVLQRLQTVVRQTAFAKTPLVAFP